jgi:hypothetical protein
LYCTHAVLANTSHLLLASPSLRFSLTSPAAANSPLAAISTTRSAMLPGIPPGSVPVMFAALGLPFGSSSGVLIHAGCGSPDSNDE